MAGFYALLNQQPSLGQLVGSLQAGGLTGSSRQQQANEQERMAFAKAQAEAQQRKTAEEDLAKQQAMIEQQMANKKRYAAQLIQANPSQAPMVMQWLQSQGLMGEQQQAPQANAQGSDVYNENNAIANIQSSLNPHQNDQPHGLPTEQQNPDQLAMQLQGSASGVLGAPKPEDQKQLPLDDIAKQVILGQRLQPGTVEFSQAYNDRLAAEEALKAQGGRNAPTELKLRQEFQNLATYKNTSLIAEALARAKATSASAQGDMALVFAYMKLMDPTSVVREGEYASAKNTTGIPGQIINMYNSAVKGKILTPEQRSGFMREANGLFKAQLGRYEAVAQQYRGLAQRAGFDPQNVVLDLGYDKAIQNNKQPRKTTVSDIEAEARRRGLIAQ